MRLDIQFANDDDLKFLGNLLLKDSDAKGKINFVGGDAFKFKNDRWNATFIAKHENEFVGFACCSTYAATNTSRLEELYVVKKFRNVGFGKQLLQFCEEFMHRNWHARAFDCLTIENKPMELLLKKSRYKLKGTYKNFTYNSGRFKSQSYWQKAIR